MAKKRKSQRRSGGAIVALVVTVAVAVALGYWLLSPNRAPAPHGVAQASPAPESTAAPQPSSSPEPTQTPAPSPTASPSPQETATPAQPPLPELTPRPNAGGARLALIVDDCGQWIDTERAFLALGIPLTMSVLPDVPYTGTIQKEAAAAGKGVMLHLPMETVSGLNPGPGKVTTEMTDEQIRSQVASDLDQVPLARGVNNHEGSKGSADERLMRDVIGVLAARGDLFFIDSRTSPDSVAERVAAAGGVPTAGRDVFLDNKDDVDYVEAQLREAAAIARRTGSAIAIGHPRAATLAAVRALIPQLRAEGIEFVLAGDLVGAPTATPPSTQ